jgi:hypothetical protein
LVELAASIAATATESPYVNPDPALAQALVAGAAAGQQKSRSSRKVQGSAIDGWNSAMHGFDYNPDHLGLGTLDDPEWKIQQRAAANATRAAAARGGLWGNDGYEATYATAWTDANAAVDSRACRRRSESWP